MCLFNVYWPFVYLCRPGPYNGALDLGIWKICGFSWVIGIMLIMIYVFCMFIIRSRLTQLGENIAQQFVLLNIDRYLISVLFELYGQLSMDRFHGYISMSGWYLAMFEWCFHVRKPANVFAVWRNRRYFFKKSRFQNFPTTEVWFFSYMFEEMLYEFIEVHSKSPLLL